MNLTPTQTVKPFKITVETGDKATMVIYKFEFPPCATVSCVPSLESQISIRRTTVFSICINH